MKITYFKHSGFAVELDHHILIFDYIEGNLKHLKHNLPLYVFVSHRHGDHYKKEIFETFKEYNCTFILSDDIHVKKMDHMIKIGSHQEIKVDDLEIRTLHSTDEGVAFLVETEGRLIYHAGDLHWWHWEGENTDLENEEAKQMYLDEVEIIKDEHIDVAFLVVDSRQKKQFAWGMKAFLDRVACDYVFPMHCWENYAIIKKAKKELHEEQRKKIAMIHHPDEMFLIEGGDVHEI